MADVKCPSCGEPFESYHMRHDEIWETDLPEKIINEASEKGTPLTPMIKKALERRGWKFPKGANSVLSFIRCPYCDDTDKADDEAILKRQIAEDLLGDDEDAYQTMLEDGEL